MSIQSMGESLLRVGVIGFGHWGPNLARNVHQHNSTQLVAIADSSSINLEKAKALYPFAKIWDDSASLIRSNDIDALVISSPASTHFDLTLLALEMGLHVLVTKPFTLRYDQAETLHRIARIKKRVILVDHTFVYAPAFNNLKNIINSGTLGKVLYYDSMRSGLGIFKSDVDVIHDLAIHDIAIAHHLFNEKPYAVSAVSNSNIAGQLPSQCYINLFYPNNLCVHIAAHWLSPLKQRRIILAGSKQMICWDDTLGGSSLTLYDSGVTTSSSKVLAGRAPIEYRSGTATPISFENMEALALEIDDFVHAIKTNNLPICDAKAACDIMKVTDAALDSARSNGAPITIKWGD